MNTNISSLVKILSLFFLALQLSSCAFAPITNTTSARSSGKDNLQMTANIAYVPGVTATYGITENLNVGALLEIQYGTVISAFGQYSIINEKEGFSLAGYFGVFSGSSIVDTKGVFVGPIFSYKTGFFEPYFLVKFNSNRWDKGSVDLEESEDSFFDKIQYDKGRLDYLSYTLGSTFWFSESFGLIISAQSFQVISPSSSKISGVLPQIALQWR